jgi:hypothetical protein
VDRINQAQILLWMILSVCLLPGSGHYFFDEALFHDAAMALARFERFPVLGPFISGTVPAAYTPGGGLFILLAPAGLLGADPRWMVGWIIALSCLGIWILDRTLAKQGESAWLRFYVVTLLIWSAWHSYMSDRIWNVHLFWFLSPVLISIALRLGRAGAVGVGLWGLLGVVSAFILQVHLGGALLVTACFALISSMNRRLPTLLQWAVLGTGFLFPYLPYLWSEVQNGFANTQLMSGSLRGLVRGKPAMRAFLAPLIYVSHYHDVVRVGTWLDIPKLITHAIGIVLVVFSLRVRSWLRFLAVAGLILMPLYFLVNRRDFYHHYIASLLPIYVMLPALAMERLRARFPRAVNGYLAFFVVTSVGVVTHRYLQADHGMRVADRLEKVGAIVASNQPVESQSMDEEAYVLWQMGRRMFGAEIQFRVDGKLCRVAMGYHGNRPGTYHLHSTCYFDCDGR